MSTFLERKVGTSCVTCLCWKQTAPSYVAVGTTSGSVEFYWSDCTECDFPNLSYQSRTSKTRHVTSLTFHPVYDILIAFWSDGVMRSWNCEKGTISSQMSPHSVGSNSHLNVLFNLNGTRLISTDYRGVVSIWSCANGGSLHLLYTFKLKYGCSHISLYNCHRHNTTITTDDDDDDSEAISAFYLSNNDGQIYLTTDDGHCNDILALDKHQEDDSEIHLRLLQYIASHSKLVFITHDMTLYVYDIANHGQKEMGAHALSLNKSFKLCIKATHVNVICVYLFDALIAICNEQSVLHIFDVIHNDNYILSLTDSRHKAAPNDTIDRLKFIQSTKVLIGITCKNRIVLWKYGANGNDNGSEKDWNVLPPIALSRDVAYIDSGFSSHFYNPNDIAIAVFDGELKVFSETKLHFKYYAGYTLIQFAPNRLLIYTPNDKMKKIRTPFTILMVANAGNLVFVSNGEAAQLYRIGGDTAPPQKVYEWDEILCSSAAIHYTSSIASIIVCYHNNIRIYSCNGVLKTTLTFGAHEGFPITMDLHQSVLAVVTTENILKVWHLSGDDLNMKSVIPQRKLDEYANANANASSVESIKLNATSNKISILLMNANSTLYIYDIEKDECNTFELDANLTIEDIIWEQNDARFLSILWKKSPQNNDNESISDCKQEEEELFSEEEMRRVKIKSTRRESMLEMTNSEAERAAAKGSPLEFGVISFFIAPDGEILPQEMFPTKWRFVGLAVPDFIFVSIPTCTANTNTNDESSNTNPKVIRKRIRDFIGINNIDGSTKNNLMNFSYFLTVGDLDEAYRSVQNIKSSSVWENMARMCVKTRRLDVAQICISNLSSSRGTSARVASSLFFDDAANANTNDDNLRLAMVAIDLKMYEDAEELLSSCGRYDLIVKMYQALGRWMSAIEICSKHDRIALAGARFKYGMYLEQCGKVEAAMELYERSDCPLKIAQMLYQQNRIDILTKYVTRSSCRDVSLLRWFAQYLESNEDYAGAQPFYERAKDHVSMVRLCCQIGDITRAESIISKTKSSQAAFHLASYYEDHCDIDNAIKFYKESGAYHHALRLAKEHELDEMLVDIALVIPDSVLTKRSNPKEIAAKYFYDIGDLSKAVMLYERAGNMNKAMDVCIEGQLFDSLRNIASKLTATNNTKSITPTVATRFAEYFMKYEQYEKAVSMLIIAKQYSSAISMISNNGVRITPQLAEELTPPKHPNMNESELAQRQDIVRGLAHCLKQQQHYQLACKKYTQCGDKMEAIKCLSCAGDTKKVIYYASKCKGRESHDANIFAANYLQSLDWHSNTQYMKHIVQFYSAAKAYQQLAFFYDAMAQIEIDDYRDYDKALRALKQAYKQMKRADESESDKLLMFEQRISLVNRFCCARKCAESDPNQMVSICESLMKESNLECAIRVGDVYALLVEYYHSCGDMNEAYNVIQRMNQNKIILEPYLDKNMLKNIYDVVGVHVAAAMDDDTNAINDAIEEDIINMQSD